MTKKTEKTPSTMRGDETVSRKLGTDQRELLRKEKERKSKKKKWKEVKGAPVQRKPKIKREEE